MPKIRQTKRIFRWHVAVPATLTGIAGILLCCADAAPIPMVIAVAVVFLLSGIAAVAGYFINASQNIAGVLIGAGQVAVSVWMFMEYNALPWTVLGLACGALACLYALFCVLEGVALRRTERIWPARIVFAALYAALGILLVVNYFAPFFGDSVNCVVTAGAFACVLVKPQFECENKNIGKSGIVARKHHPDILSSVFAAAAAERLAPVDIVNAPVREKKNVEYMLLLEKDGISLSEAELLRRAMTLAEER